MLKYFFSLTLVLLSNILSCQEFVDPPEIISVSVDPETGYTLTTWDASTTDDITEYTIWLSVISGLNNQISWEVIPGSSVLPSGLLMYTHTLSEANEHSVGYSVKAHKGSASSNIMQTDSTIYLISSFDSCNSSITLEWNDYNSWRGNIYGYEIYQSVNNGAYTLEDFVEEGTNSIDIDNLLADRNYAHYIVAIRDNAERTRSSSNKAEVVTTMAHPPDYIRAEYATYSNDNAIDMEFIIDGDSELNTYNLLRATSPSGPFEVVASFYDIYDSVFSYTDNVNYSLGPYYYQLSSINNCNQVARTSENIAGTIVLNGENNSLVNELGWNEYENWQGGIDRYEVRRRFGNEAYEIIGSGNHISYTDDLSALLNTSTSGMVCYSIRAVENTGSTMPSESASNEWCTQLPLNIRFEFDAFIPDNPAGNNTFGPTIDFLPDEILFRIFNKWGEVVFESKDPYQLRWNGHINNIQAPEGVYVYFLYARTGNEKPLKLRGNVTVAYP